MSMTQFIDRPEEVVDLCRQLRAAGEFALDTEFVTEDTFTPVLCLVQIATRDRLAVVDALAVPELGGLWSILGESDHRIVAHAAEAEVRFCRHYLGRPPSPVFDVQIAAGLAGYGYPLSYTNLVRRVLGANVRGTETRTDWRRRPLTEKQLHYALEDVRHLLAVRDKLAEELQRAGRMPWAEEEFREQVARAQPADGEAWRRVSGTTSLNRRQLAVLSELAAWRAGEAQRRNRPVRSVASDDVLIELAKRQPTDLRDLVMFRGMNRRHLRRVADELLAAVHRGVEVPEAECPSLPRKPDDSEQVRILTGVLSTALATICAREKLPIGLVASTADLAHLVRGYINSGAVPAGSPLASGWRQQLCSGLFLDLLEGKLCLRVRDVKAEMPLVIEAARIEDR